MLDVHIYEYFTTIKINKEKTERKKRERKWKQIPSPRYELLDKGHFIIMQNFFIRLFEKRLFEAVKTMHWNFLIGFYNLIFPLINICVYLIWSILEQKNLESQKPSSICTQTKLKNEIQKHHRFFYAIVNSFAYMLSCWLSENVCFGIA